MCQRVWKKMLVNWVNSLEVEVEKHSFRIVENECHIVVHFKFGLDEKEAILALISSRPLDVLPTASLYHHNTADRLTTLTLGEDFLIDGDDCELLLLKNTGVSPFFVSVAGFEKSLPKITAASVVYVNSDEGFSSLSCDFLPLGEYSPCLKGAAATDHCENSFATFLTGRFDFLIDLSIPFFLHKGGGQLGSQYALAWKRQCCKYLVYLLGNKVEVVDSKCNLIAKSEKKLAFEVDENVDLDVFVPLQDLARWLILPKRDAKVRHQIYVGCLVREGSNEDDVWKFFASSAEHALEAAQLSYDSLLDKEARESLKVMIDIRKAIFDAASQISKDAQEISSRAATDIAAVVGLLIARVALIDKNGIDPLVAKSLLLAAILYVGYRVYTVIFVSKEFFKSNDMARDAWNVRVYSTLNKKDREELSEQPILRAKAILTRSIDFAGIAYGLIMFALILILFWEMLY